MKLNHIHEGDCIKIMQTEVLTESVQLIFADPPYNLSGKSLKWKGNKTGGDWFMVDELWDKMSEDSYFIFCQKWLQECYRVLLPNGSIYVSCSYHNLGEILLILKVIGFNVKNIITWYKSNSMPNMTKRVFTHSTEFIVWAVKGKNWIFNYNQLKEINPEKQKDGNEKQMRDFWFESGIWSLPLVQGKERLKDVNGRALHPTQKPEEMLKRIIIASSNENEIVLDPFIGSGTTAVVARQLKRKYIGIEKEKKYISAAKKRLKK